MFREPVRAQMSDCIMVYITTSTRDEAASIGKALVERRLAACVNILPGIRSFYNWEGRLCDEEEVLLLAKTTRGAFEKLLAAVRELHSYSVPVVNAFAVEAGNQEYLDWVRSEVEDFDSPAS